MFQNPAPIFPGIPEIGLIMVADDKQLNHTVTGLIQVLIEEYLIKTHFFQ